jgi:hypothetical protein
MSESLSDHKIQGIGGTGIGSSTERVLGHDFGNSNGRGLVSSSHNTERKILGGEDTSNSVVIVGNQDTVLPLRSHQLSSLRDGGTRLDLKSLTRLQGENCSGRSLSGVASSACEVLLLGEIIFELLSDGLITLALLLTTGADRRSSLGRR